MLSFRVAQRAYCGPAEFLRDEECAVTDLLPKADASSFALTRMRANFLGMTNHKRDFTQFRVALQGGILSNL
jgi:hypothetical protein